MNERDIWASAKRLIDLDGDDASIVAAMRADELLDAGDLDGAATWRRVIVAIKELKNTAPSGAVN
jgi:hypothetical protein